MEEDWVIFALKLTRQFGDPNLRGFRWFGDRTNVFPKRLDSSSTCDCSDLYFVIEHGGVPVSNFDWDPKYPDILLVFPLYSLENAYFYWKDKLFPIRL